MSEVEYNVLLDPDYHKWYKRIDVRTKNLPFMESVYQVPILLVAYLLAVYIVIPVYMRNKKPYDLRGFTRFYNLMQVLTNGYLTLRTLDLMQLGIVPLNCDPGAGRTEYHVAFYLWITAMLKIFDLVETVVFALRKKQRQISFLHVYHHVSMVLLTWMVARHIPRGMALTALSLNTFVHMIMYSYYFLSTFDGLKAFTNSIKQYITIMQMVQFLVLLVYLSQTVYPGCGIPAFLQWLGITQVLVNLALFVHFYRQTYKKPGKKTK